MSGAREQVKMLVVKDDQHIRFLVADFFRAQGYQVLEASNGQTGLRLAEDNDPHVVLLDLALPETPGVEVLHELHRMEPFHSPRIVVTSAYPELLDPDDYQSVDAFFTKPYDLERLLNWVADVTSRGAASKPLGSKAPAAAS